MAETNNMYRLEFDEDISESNGLLEDVQADTEYRIRRLTERECWRLMGFTDDDFNKAAKVNSATQLYKQAGNSIVVNVLTAIFGQMIEGKENVYKDIDKDYFKIEDEP